LCCHVVFVDSGKFTIPGGCQNCPPGTYTSVPGSTSCLLCPKGETYIQHHDVTMSREMRESSMAHKHVACSWMSSVLSLHGSGSFNPQEGNTFCTTCAAGDACSTNGCAACTPCSPGHYSPFDGTTTCTTCAAGSYATYMQSTSCTLCTPGTYSAFSASSSCSNCWPGSFQPLTGAKACTNCSVGTVSAVPASTTPCSICAAGTYAFKAGQTACSTCNAGTYSAPQAKTCTQCAAGQNDANMQQLRCFQHESDRAPVRERKLDWILFADILHWLCSTVLWSCPTHVLYFPPCSICGCCVTITICFPKTLSMAVSDPRPILFCW
jgi:hypothetical protein